MHHAEDGGREISRKKAGRYRTKENHSRMAQTKDRHLKTGKRIIGLAYCRHTVG